MKTKNDFGFILTAEFGFLFAKLNLSFGLEVVLKTSTKDYKKIFIEKKCVEMCLIAY